MTPAAAQPAAAPAPAPAPAPPPPRQWPLRYALPAMGALPTAPRTARAHVRDVLGQWGLTRLEDNAVLIASELVTNAVRQATSQDGTPAYINGSLPLIQLTLLSDRARLLIAVYDQAPGIPVQARPAHDAENGRGLALIATLGTWDWHPAKGGKVVRALLAAAA